MAPRQGQISIKAEPKAESNKHQGRAKLASRQSRVSTKAEPDWHQDKARLAPRQSQVGTKAEPKPD